MSRAITTGICSLLLAGGASTSSWLSFFGFFFFFPRLLEGQLQRCCGSSRSDAPRSSTSGGTDSGAAPKRGGSHRREPPGGHCRPPPLRRPRPRRLCRGEARGRLVKSETNRGYFEGSPSPFCLSQHQRMSQTQAIGGGVTSRTVEAPGLGQKSGKVELSSHVNSPGERPAVRETPERSPFSRWRCCRSEIPAVGSGERTWSGGLCAKSSPKSCSPPAGSTRSCAADGSVGALPLLRAAPHPHSRRCARGSRPPRAIPHRTALPAPPAAPTPWRCCFPRSGTPLQLPQLICFWRNNAPARYHAGDVFLHSLFYSDTHFQAKQLGVRPTCIGTDPIQ